jgi:hypothetical protein
MGNTVMHGAGVLEDLRRDLWTVPSAVDNDASSDPMW